MQDHQELAWGKLPPSMAQNPDSNDQDAVLLEIKRTEGSIRGRQMKSGALLSVVWGQGWFVSTDYPERTLANMSRWLIKEHDIDLTPVDIRMRVMPYVTFSPFGKKMVDWLSQFSPSTGYELARAARMILPNDPLIMSKDEIDEARTKCIQPMIDLFPYRAGVRDVFPILRKNKLLSDAPVTGTTIQCKRPRADEISILQIIALSNTGMISDDQHMFIPRRNPRRLATEQKWCDWLQAYCEAHDIDRDEAFARIMANAMKNLPIQSEDV